MTVLTEGPHTGEYIVSEANGTRSREVITLASGTTGIAGMVLGKVTASSKYVPLAPAATDGSQNAAAILFDNVDASATDRAAVITARDTEVRGSSLTWPAGISAPNKAAALAALAALGIVER